MYKPLSHIDCFAGPGGFCTGLHAAGFDTLVAIEYVKDCVDTYTKNHPEVHVIHSDIREVTEDDILPYIPADGVDLVTSGNPCETFSSAGTVARYVHDHRQYLFREGLRIAKIANAKFVLFENVEGIKNKTVSSGSKELVLDILKKELVEAGYGTFKQLILNAKDFGVPQSRKRFFLLATRLPDINLNDIENLFEKVGRHTTVGEAFIDLGKGCSIKEIDPNVGVGYQPFQPDKISGYSLLMKNKTFWRRENMPDCFHYHVLPIHKDYMVERYSLLGPMEGLNTLFDRYAGTPQFEDYKNRKVLPNKKFGQSGRRIALDKVSYTVTSHAQSELVHPIEPRTLTVRECARLQSFPDDYDFCGGEYRCRYNFKDRQSKIEQIGDAVPPLLAYNWGKVIEKIIEKS